MTPQEINIEIAKACGWIIPDGCVNYRVYKGRTVFFNPFTENDPIPNYHGDLNAMHEAETYALRPVASDNAMEKDEKFVKWDNYQEYLVRRIGPSNIVFATAAQRAEAFLRTLNLWKD